MQLLYLCCEFGVPTVGHQRAEWLEYLKVLSYNMAQHISLSGKTQINKAAIVTYRKPYHNH